MTDEQRKVLADYRSGKVSRETALKFFGLSRQDMRNLIANIELAKRVYGSRN